MTLPTVSLCALSLATLVARPSAQAVEPPELRVLAASGDAAPATLPGTVFASFTSANSGFAELEPPVIDRQGNVAFVATLTGPGIVPALEVGTNAMAIYSVTDGVTLEQVAQLGDPVPGEPGAVFTDFGNTFGATFAYLDAYDGRVSFQANGGVFAQSLAGELTRFVTDPPFDGVPPGVDVELESLGGGLPAQLLFGEVEPDGSVVARMLSPGPNPSKRAWMVRTWPDAPPQVVLGDDYPAPGVPGAVVGNVDTVCTDNPAITTFHFAEDSTSIPLTVTLVGPGIDCNNDQVLYHFVDDQPSLVLREGDPAPGFETVPGEAPPVIGESVGFEAFFAGGMQVRANAAGQLAFGAVVSGGLAGGLDQAIYTDRSGELELVVRADDLCTSGDPDGAQVPGMPAGFTFSRLRFGDFNDAAQLAFRATIGDSKLPELQACLTAVDALFWDANGPLEALAVGGEPVGLFGPDVVYGAFGIPSLLDADVAFCEVTLAGPEVDLSNDRALIAWDRDLRPRELLREGQTLEVAGVPRVLERFVLGRGVSRLGEVAVRLLFVDGGEALAVLRIVDGDLLVDEDTLSSQVADQAEFTLLAGAGNAARPYVLLASLSGTSPGITFPLGATLPLNFDSFMNFTIAHLNSPVFDRFMGELDVLGRAEATLNTQVPLGPAAVGLGIDFAFLVLQPIDHASTAVRVEIVD